MSRLPARLMPVDFFKILEEEPQEIVIKEASIKEDEKSFNSDWLGLKLELVETGQTTSYASEITYGESSRDYYIRIGDVLHPLLSYESGIENNALTYMDDELVELLTGLRFKATGRTEPLEHEKRGHFGKGYRNKHTLIPITEEAV